MLGGLIQWFVDIPRLGGSDETEESGHAGSLLDASVNYAYEQSDGREAVREMQKVNEEASKLRDADERHR